MIANVGIAASSVFYDCTAASYRRPERSIGLDRCLCHRYSRAGVLLVNLAWILSPATFGLADLGRRDPVVIVSVAVGALVFSPAAVFRVREPPFARPMRADAAAGSACVAMRLRRRFTSSAAHRQAFLMLVAFLLYNDGIGPSSAWR